MEIQGNHILITGANRGIGKAVALMCAEDHAHLHLVLRNIDGALKDELVKAGAKSVSLYQVDLSQRPDREKFLATISEQPIDILFNNAGQLTGGLLEEQSLSDIEAMLEVNVMALIHLTKAILPKMILRKKGKIINHSSVSAVMNFPCSSTYAASKAAVLAFTNSLRIETKGTGVSTLCLITPGVETRMFGDIPKLYGQYFDLDFLKGIPPKKYAQMIREAILEDLTELKPHGVTGASLLIAQHLPKAFEKIVLKRFRRFPTEAP